MKALSSLEKYSDYHLALLRVGLGLHMFLGWGMGKLLAGPERWAGLGEAMATYGITFFPTFWGFMATFAESIGALLIAFGLFTRYNALLLGFTMLTVILARHTEDIMAMKFNAFGTPFYVLLICIVLVITGAGTKWNLEKKLLGKEV